MNPFILPAGILLFLVSWLMAYQGTRPDTVLPGNNKSLTPDKSPLAELFSPGPVFSPHKHFVWDHHHRSWVPVRNSHSELMWGILLGCLLMLIAGLLYLGYIGYL